VAACDVTGYHWNRPGPGRHAARMTEQMTEKPNPPDVSREARLDREARLTVMNSIANSMLYGQPWGSIEEIGKLAARVIKHPPQHPEKKRDEIVAKVAEIQRLAAELLEHMPKAKHRRGAVGID
jgi:hypothetical protein